MNMANSPWSALGWFLAVVALIPLLLWLLKRSPVGPGLGGFGGASGAPGRNGLPRLVSVLPLATQQKLVTIEVGQGEERLWLVLGVTPHSIRTVHTMAAQTPPAATPAAPPAAAFAQLLGRLRHDGSPRPNNGPRGDDHAR